MIHYTIFFLGMVLVFEVLYYMQIRVFFPKIVDMFRMCEDLENLYDLHMIFKLVEGISYEPV